MRDYYEPKMIMGVIKKTLPLRTFFKTRYFNNPVMFPTEKVSFEFQEQKRKLAPYVNPRAGSEDIGREEYMCARVKQDGRLTIKGKGVSEVVDYGFENIAVLDASDRWTPTFDIMGQLQSIAREMRKDGINPDMMILGTDAAKMLLQNERYLKLLDNRA